MRWWSIAGVVCAVGCSEPLVDGVLTESEWASAQTFSRSHLRSLACTDCRDAELGHQLFFDKRLSGPIKTASDLGNVGEERRVACADCHDPSAYFVDKRSMPSATSIGTDWTKRNALGLVNVGYLSTLTWSGQYTDLVSLVDLPIKKAMNSDVQRVALVIGSSYDSLGMPGMPVGTNYDELYHRAAEVLAAYQQQLVDGPSDFDRYLDGERDAISDLAKRGFQVFVGRGLCSECHAGPLFTDQKFFNTGVPQSGLHVPASDPGRFDVTGLDHDAGRFRTPSLRNVAATAPYMHTGELSTLSEVIDFYRWGGGTSGFAGERDERILPLEIDDDDARALEAFLRTLTGTPVDARWTRPPTLP